MHAGNVNGRESLLIPWGQLGVFTSEPDDHGDPEASGSVNRSSCPESIRYMSVTIVA